MGHSLFVITPVTIFKKFHFRRINNSSIFSIFPCAVETPSTICSIVTLTLFVREDSTARAAGGQMSGLEGFFYTNEVFTCYCSCNSPLVKSRNITVRWGSAPPKLNGNLLWSLAPISMPTQAGNYRSSKEFILYVSVHLPMDIWFSAMRRNS